PLLAAADVGLLREGFGLGGQAELPVIAGQVTEEVEQPLGREGGGEQRPGMGTALAVARGQERPETASRRLPIPQQRGLQVDARRSALWTVPVDVAPAPQGKVVGRGRVQADD